MPSTDDLKQDFQLSTTNLSYSFQIGRWDGTYNEGSTPYPDYFSSTSTIAWQTSLGEAVEAWDNYSVLSLTPTISNSANINIYHANIADDGLTGYFEVGNNSSTGATPLSSYNHAEIVIKNSYSTVIPRSFYIALHEMGHALGLRDLDTSSIYNSDMSVMSSNVVGAGTRYAITPMAYDIAALEEKYGANTVATGNSNYGNTYFTGANRAFTIQDTGGVDAFDLSSVAGNHRINLNEAIDANDQWAVTDGVADGAATIVNGTEYVYIARGTQIENATGGSGNDTIIGNDLANTLTGNDGSDHLYGGSGSDTLNGGAGVDYLNYGAGDDTFTVGLNNDDFYNGGEGHDTFSVNSISTSSPYSTGFSDDDNHFTVDLPVTYTSLTIYTYPNSANLFSFAIYRDDVPNNMTQAAMHLFSLGDDIYVAFDADGLLQYGPSIKLMAGVGKDLAYGNDLLAYLYSKGKVDISGILNGNFTINVGHEVTGSSSEDTLRLNTNITQATGGTGADTFVADTQSYTATITDFSIAQGDKIDLTKYDGQISTFSSLNITGTTSAVVHLPGASTITVNNVAASALTIDKFLSNTMNYGTGSGIAGGATADTLAGSFANDTLWGNEGNDSISAGTGNDTIYGWTGADTLNGSYGQDFIGGDQDNDVLSGGGGNDTLEGGDGNDYMIGGAGADSFTGGNGLDTVDYSANTVGVTVSMTNSFAATGGDAAGDTFATIEQIVGSAYADSISGTSGNDYFASLGGNDTLLGGDGNDGFSPGTGADSIVGGNGVDSLDYYYSSQAVWIDFYTFTGQGGDAQGDTYATIEIAYGSNTGNDTIVGYTSNDGIYGMGGNDYIYGYTGNDTLDGGAGNDLFLFYGNHGADTVLNFEGEGAAGGDAIELYQTAYGNFTALQSHISYNTGNSTAVIDLGSGNTITLTGVTTQFVAGDFYFS